MQAVNPYDESHIREYENHSDEQVEEFISNVNTRFGSWRNTTFETRRGLMKQAAENLRHNKEEYARLMTTEMGKIITESRAEVEKSAWVCDYFAENGEAFLADEPIKSDAGKSFVSFEPIGIVLAIMPWNFPFWQVFRFAAPALMAGNTALLKHASNVPGCALAIERVFREAAFPDDVFRTLLIPSGKVEKIIRDSRVKAVTLTGSEPAGKSVAAIAGDELKKTVLELGGSDPYIVLEDADLEACVKTAVKARMINAGQSCIAAKRFIVVREICEKFERELVRSMKALKTGNPLDEQTTVGPLARADLVDELDEQVRHSLEQGATLLLGGKRIDGKGFFYEPTVLKNVRKGMAAYEQETFGPVVAIIEAADAEDAVRIANDSDFGLGGSLWTKDLQKGEQLARKVESGAVFVNGMTKSDPRLPFGGIKRSGYGRELSHYGIKEFVNIKTIWIA